MIARPCLPLGCALALALPSLTQAAPQEPCDLGWIPTFGEFVVPDDPLNINPRPSGRALAVFDDGSGPALYAGGDFELPGESNIDVLKYSASGVEVVATGFPGRVADMCVHDDGTGPALYAAINEFTFPVDPGFERLRKFDGQEWTAVPAPAGIGSIQELLSWDDGSGSKLYATVTNSFGVPTDVVGLGAWDGQSWSQVGNPLFGIRSIAPFDDGSGVKLYAAGDIFGTAGGVIDRVARLENGTWEEVGGGLSGAPILDLEVRATSQGDRLVAYGLYSDLQTPGDDWLREWDGQAWSSIDMSPLEFAEFTGFQKTLFDVPPGSALEPGLYFAGSSLLTNANETSVGFLRYDDQGWHAVGSGIPGGDVFDMELFDDGSGLALFVAFEDGGCDSGDRGLGKWGCDGSSVFESVPGCGELKPALVPVTGSLVVGETVRLLLTGNVGVATSWLVYLGEDGADGNGCGVDFAGLGEVLLDLSAPFEFLGLAIGAPPAVPVQFTATIPEDPALVGVEIAVQGAAPGLGGLGQIRFTRSLVATIQD